MSGEPQLFRFGPFELDIAAAELTRDGRRVRLGWQSFQMLRLLVSRPGEVITRDEMRRALWPDGLHVDFDHGLNNAAARLRRSLGDPAAAPRFIETLPRVGYRFIAPVTTRAAAVAVAAAPRRYPIAPAWIGIAVAVAFIAGAAAAVLLVRESPRAAVPPPPHDASEARAHSERSLIYTRLVLDGELPAGLVHEPARAAAARAMSLDPMLADAHVAAGFAAMWGAWDWAAARRLFDTAIELDPGSARARHALALWLAGRGRIDDARAQIAHALAADPASAEIARDSALFAHAAGDSAAAVEQLRVVLRRDPDDARAHELITESLAALGRSDEAAHHFRAMLVLVGISEEHANDDSRVLAANGLAGLIRRNLGRPSNKPRDRHGVPFKLASHHAFVGEADAALRWLDAAIAQRDSRLLFLNVDRRFEPLRDDPRFRQVLVRVGL